MPNNSLYDGIISPNGGIYAPGPQVSFPAAPAQKTTTAEGLNVNKVKSVQINPDGTPYYGTPLPTKNDSQLPQYPFGYAPGDAAPPPLQAIDAATAPGPGSWFSQMIRQIAPPAAVSPWQNGGVFGGAPGRRVAPRPVASAPRQVQPGLPSLPGNPSGNVMIATGKVVPIGTTADGFTVHPDGSITDKYGNVTATAKGPVGVAAVANSNSYKDASVPTPGGKFGE